MAAETGTILEINAQPDRLDLDGEHIRLAKAKGCQFSLGSDAHYADGLGVMPLGAAMARRGWPEAKDVINTWTLKKLLAYL